jgi:hypothetical protein
MQKKTKKGAIKKSGFKNSWLFYLAIVLLILVVGFFTYKGITGNIVKTQDWYPNSAIGTTNGVWQYPIPIDFPIKLSSVYMKFDDPSNVCAARVLRQAADDSWVSITGDFSELPNGNNAEKTWTITPIQDRQFKIKFQDDGACRMTIKQVRLTYECVPQCAGKCGGAADGCGGTCSLAEGCTSGQVCNAQKCCTKTYDKNFCGSKSISNGCGGMETVTGTKTCSNGCDAATNDCISSPSCTPASASVCSGKCGSIANGTCAGTITCSGCASDETCTNNVCVFNGDGSENCDDGEAWNGTACVAECDAQPGCLISGITNSIITSGFCADSKKCYECNQSYVWNNTRCELPRCTSTPGCLNITTLSNADKLTRNCSIGSCFVCKAGFSWDEDDEECLAVSGSTTWVNVTVSDLQFTAGITKPLAYYNRVWFQNYWVGVTGIDYEEFAVTLRIHPVMNKTLSVDDEQKVDFNSDGKYDLLIRLDDVDEDLEKASIYFKKINESTSSGGNSNDNNNVNSDAEVDISWDDVDSSSSNTDDSWANDDVQDVSAGGMGWLLWVIIGLFILIVIIAIIIFAVTRKDSSSVSNNTSQQNIRPVVVARPIQPTMKPVQPISSQSESAKTVPLKRVVSPQETDSKITEDIKTQLQIGNQFVSDKKILPAKAVYSKIFEMYNKLKVPNNELYSQILDYYKKLV